MLFIYEGQFVEVVRENCYQSLLTICSNDVSVLTQLADGTGTMGAGHLPVTRDSAYVWTNASRSRHNKPS